MVVTDISEDELYHYGIMRKSGRYPWGSGDNPYQRGKDFFSMVNELKKQGFSDQEIAKSFGMTTTELRATRSVSKNEVRKAEAAEALKLHDKNYSNVAIGKKMGKPESTIRNLLNPATQEREDILVTTSNMLRDAVGEDGIIQIGKGVENHIGISQTKLGTAVAMLKDEGYKVFWVPVDQLGTSHQTNVKVIAPPGTTFPDIMKRKDEIRMIKSYTEDQGRHWNPILEPKSVDSSRIAVRYAEEGGADKDGVIELRRGVEDISLGASRYAQVRVAVDGTHYLKGMAMYSDDLPDGVDILFNTNKTAASTKTKLDAMKSVKDDPENPFGSTIRQKHYIDKNGKSQLSALNIVGSESPDGETTSGEEGGWSTWSKKFSSQMLSKQSSKLAREQLNLSHDIKKAELADIKALTNPTVKRELLEAFADGAESSSVHLKAAGLPRTANHVILPINTLKDTEIYAPNYRNGETVVLVRHPHGGIFEIPELVVNNRNREANRLIKNAKDAVGINANVAARLSGADFDGDTVLVIPNNPSNRKIRVSSTLDGLKNFDPKIVYPPYDGMKTIDGGYFDANTGKIDYRGKEPKPKNKQQLMGDVSNLITDMTIMKANQAEIARAVRHSMVVIDAEKHALDYKASHAANGISELKTKYQGRANAGAATLISRSKSPTRVDERKPRPAAEGGPIDKDTGARVYVPTGRSYVKRIVSKRTGEVTEKVIVRQTEVQRMMATNDARTLISTANTPMEHVYAEYANKMKALANQARKEAVETKSIPYSKSAKKTYAPQVASLADKLNVALQNAPLERQAQILANARVDLKRHANPNLDSDGLKKLNARELAAARVNVGARKQNILITPLEWEAIQAGAISNHRLEEIIRNTDIDVVKQLAMPKDQPTFSNAMLARAKSMTANGYTQSDIAEMLGVSTSTLSKMLKEKG